MSKLRCAIYARYSSANQDARSIDDQVRRCREYTERQGFEVVAVYADKALSGKYDQREQFQALLAAARLRSFDVVVVDDLSRLTRDLGTLWQTIFGEFPAYGVVLWDAQTGIPSSSPAAKMVIGSMGLGSEQYVDNLRRQTHRGLEGRALAGFWPGGTVYGYSTEAERCPDDPKRPRRLAYIVEAEASVVREIFTLFLEGRGYKAIADLLNQRGTPAPHDGATRPKIGRGWGHTSIRSILRNERYAGRWVWNRSRSVSSPGRRWRKRVDRPKSEHVVTELPHLALIDRHTFEAAQLRIAEHSGPKDANGKHPRKGRPMGTGRTAYLVTGLLRCGSCGGSMTVVGAWKKAGARRVAFGCTSYASRGASICDNGLTISEERLTAALLDSLRDVLTSPALVEAVAQGIERRAATPKRKATAPNSTEIRDVERRLRNVVDEIENHGGSVALRKRRTELEAKLEALQVEPADEAPVPVLPSAKVLRGRVRELLADLVSPGDMHQRRAALARLVTPIRMTPQNRQYQCVGAVRFGGLLTSGKSMAGTAATGLPEVPLRFVVVPARSAA